jgi:hypothetical protein
MKNGATIYVRRLMRPGFITPLVENDRGIAIVVVSVARV